MLYVVPRAERETMMVAPVRSERDRARPRRGPGAAALVGTDAVPYSDAEIRQRHDDLSRRYATEMRLSAVVASGGGIAGLVQATAEMTANPVWLIDPQHRVVSRSGSARGSDFRAPDVDHLVAQHGPADLECGRPLIVSAQPVLGIERRHLLMPVRRDDCLFAWLVIAEVSVRLGSEDAALLCRAAFHLASEYAVQRRVARASWNARATLARQLVRGHTRDDDIADAAEYLGVQASADRVLVYIADAPGAEPRDEEELSARVAADLGVEVLATRGREGMILLVEAPDLQGNVSFVHEVKGAMRRLLAAIGDPDAIVGVSGVTRPAALQRAYRETREVVLCVDRFARTSERVIAVDDLGPARLFVANGDLGAVRRYVQDVVGPLLDGGPGKADLLRTLQCFFDTGRSVRESAARLGIHENTVRLRLAKVHDLTGLDVASDANDQLSAQTALLVLRLDGHPVIPSFGESHVADHKTDRGRDSA
ncbi:PucR family transcriptional regulator [Nocardioides sp. Root190]|uniref:PucR family transcriptional regulator n=1 Tax=Nocardioides sp. Root190 TaxID=1736488 RepID=UPI0012FA7B87|nr:helix-turn-helix domain-containing protein [Nocardioides sp. Root190]